MGSVEVIAPAGYQVEYAPGLLENAANVVRAALERQARDGKVGTKKDGSPADLHESGDLWSEVDSVERGEGAADLVFKMPYAEVVFKNFPRATELQPDYLAQVEADLTPLFNEGCTLTEL